jgi:hypothetical protein
MLKKQTRVFLHSRLRIGCHVMRASVGWEEGAVLLDRFDRTACFHDQGRTSDCSLQPQEIRHSWHRLYLSCECVNATKLSPSEIPCGTSLYRTVTVVYRFARAIGVVSCELRAEKIASRFESAHRNRASLDKFSTVLTHMLTCHFPFLL